MKKRGTEESVPRKSYLTTISSKEENGTVFCIPFLMRWQGIVTFLGISFLISSAWGDGEVVLRITAIDPVVEYIMVENIGPSDIPVSEITFSEISGTTEKIYPAQNYTSDTILKSHSSITLSFSQKINDTGDTVRIYWKGVLIERVDIPKKEAGKVYLKQSDGTFAWEIFPVPTPTPEPTIIPTPSPDPSPTPTPIDVSTPVPNTIASPTVSENPLPVEATPIPTPEPSPDATPTPNFTSTPNPVVTATPIPESSPEPTAVSTPSPDPTPIRSPSPSEEILPTPPPSSSSIPTEKPLPTLLPSVTPLPPEPIATPEPTQTPAETATPIPQPPPVLATETILRITAIDPVAEYITLENMGTSDVPVSEITFSEISGTTEKIYPAQNYTPETTLKSHSTITLSFSQKINDTGDTVRVYWKGILMDRVDVPPKEVGKVYLRQSNGSFFWGDPVSSSSTPTLSPVSTSTPTPNPTPTPAPALNPPSAEILYSSRILISEFLPNPQGSDAGGEWIELHNTALETVNISQWRLKDASGKLFSFHEGTVLLADEYRIFWKSETGITLNNDAESISLLDPQETVKSTLSFSGGILEGESVAFFAEGIQKTMTPTPAQKNIFTPPSVPTSGGGGGGGSSGKSSALFTDEPFLSLQNPRKKSITLQITKIAPDDMDADFVEVLCVDCDTDLEGIRLSDDEERFRIPAGTYAKTGDILLFRFVGEGKEKRVQKAIWGWQFSIPEKGLTKTDETIVLLDYEYTVLDAVCYADRSGTLSGGEAREIAFLIHKGAIKGIPTEYACADSEFLQKGDVLLRKNGEDTNTGDDFYLSPANAFESPEKTPPQTALSATVVFSKIFSEKKHISIGLQNTGEKSVDLHLFSLISAGKKVFSFENPTPLLPSEEILISLPQKTIKAENMILSLRDAYGTREDFLCANMDIKGESVGSLLKDEYQKEGWNSPSLDFCIPHFSVENSGFSLSRTALKDTNSAEDFAWSDDSPLSIVHALPLVERKTTAKKNASVKKEKKKKVEVKALALSEISSFRFSSVVPNPTGKDTGYEYVVIKNKRNQSGVMKGWSIFNGKSTKKLPVTVFEGQEEIRFHAPWISSLKNTDGLLVLRDAAGHTRGKTFWKNAKANDVYGLFGKLLSREPPKIKKHKTHSSRSKKSVARLPILPPVLPIFSDLWTDGFVVSQQGNTLTIIKNEEVRTFTIATGETVFLPGTHLSFIVTRDGVLTSFHILAPPPQNSVLSSSPHSFWSSFFHILLVFLDFNSKCNRVN